MRPPVAVLCRDSKSLATLQAALAKLDMPLLRCSSDQDALERVVAGICSTLIVDFDLPGAEEVVRMAALLPPAQKPTLLAVASRVWPSTGEAFHSGASRIFYRPIEEEQVKDALRAAGNPSMRSRQGSARYEMKTLVHLECDTPFVQRDQRGYQRTRNGGAGLRAGAYAFRSGVPVQAPGLGF